MREEWLDDIVAIFDTGSLVRAADARFLTQPAFSRRINAIERYLGVQLLDRTQKPAVLHPSIRQLEHRIREIVALKRELVYDIKDQDRSSRNRIVICGQHSTIVTVAARLTKLIDDSLDITTSFQSENRDECIKMLITRQAHVNIIHGNSNDNFSANDSSIEEIFIGEEVFGPVCSPEYKSRFLEDMEHNELRFVSYPSNVFLGEIMVKEIYPKIGSSVKLRKRTETAFTLAIRQFALEGIGVAWIPKLLAKSDFARKRLIDLSDYLPQAHFTIVAQRLKGEKTPAENLVWDRLSGILEQR